MDMIEVADPDAVHAVRSFIKKQLASELKEEFLIKVKNNRSSEKYEFNHSNVARHALKNIALGYLAPLKDPELAELALDEYRSATNMTDQFAALAAIAQNPGKICDDVVADFYKKWQHDFLDRRSKEQKKNEIWHIKVCQNSLLLDQYEFDPK